MASPETGTPGTTRVVLTMAMPATSAELDDGQLKERTEVSYLLQWDQSEEDLAREHRPRGGDRRYAAGQSDTGSMVREVDVMHLRVLLPAHGPKARRVWIAASGDLPEMVAGSVRDEGPPAHPAYPLSIHTSVTPIAAAARPVTRSDGAGTEATLTIIRRIPSGNSA